VHFQKKIRRYALPFMKRIVEFFKKEWFLLVMIAAITLIVLLFELF
jgi:hypothetical protein